MSYWRGIQAVCGSPGRETHKLLAVARTGRIGRFKIPKKVIVTNAIPRTPTGKILKRVLREQFN